MKRDFTIGIISGVFLTFFGVIIQFQCNKCYENSKEIKRMNIISLKQLSDCWDRSYLLYETSESSVFKDRWNNYIYNVYYPWRSNIHSINAHIKQNYPAIHSDFECVCSEFESIHANLNELRKLQNPSTNLESQSLELIEKEVENRLKNLKITIHKIKDTLSN